MAQVSFQTAEAFEVDPAELGTVVVRTGFATVHHLGFEEVPQPPSSPVAILNLTGWCSFEQPGPAGVCVMAVGRDRWGGWLWAACLRAGRRQDDTVEMVESVLVAPEVVGHTSRISVRVYGGRFTDPNGDQGA